MKSKLQKELEELQKLIETNSTRKTLMCPKCGDIRFPEAEKTLDAVDKVCDYCSTKRIDVNENIDDSQLDEESDRNLFEQRMHRKHLFNNPLFDEETFERRIKEEEDFMQGVRERVANLPKCPICQSTNIHKITGANKVGSALMFGVFAAGHVSKTYKCDNCGSKF